MDTIAAAPQAQDPEIRTATLDEAREIFEAADPWIERNRGERGWRIVDRKTGDDLTDLFLDGCFGIILHHPGHWEVRNVEGRDYVIFGGFFDHWQYPPGERRWIKCARSDFPNDLARAVDFERSVFPKFEGRSVI